MRQPKWLKLKGVLEQIAVSRSTFDICPAACNAPRTYILQRGLLCFKQVEVDEWLYSRAEYNGKGAAWWHVDWALM